MKYSGKNVELLKPTRKDFEESDAKMFGEGIEGVCKEIEVD